MRDFDYSEIKNGERFESLVFQFFENMRNPKGAPTLKILKAGKGPDGGRDMLISFQIYDDVVSEQYEIRWVVQCKYSKHSISTSDISDINIPSLVHQNNASGYLLVCSTRPTNKLTNMFEMLNSNCRFKYKYSIWDGDLFKHKILTDEKLLRFYFPKFYRSMIKGKKCRR